MVTRPPLRSTGEPYAVRPLLPQRHYVTLEPATICPKRINDREQMPLVPPLRMSTGMPYAESIARRACVMTRGPRSAWTGDASGTCSRDSECPKLTSQSLGK